MSVSIDPCCAHVIKVFTRCRVYLSHSNTGVLSHAVGSVPRGALLSREQWWAKLASLLSVNIPEGKHSSPEGWWKRLHQKMGDVFPLLVWPLQAVGAVVSQRDVTLLGGGSCWLQNQLCTLFLPWSVPERGLLLWPCTDLSPPDTPPRTALNKEIPLLSCPTYHTKPGERRLLE